MFQSDKQAVRTVESKVVKTDTLEVPTYSAPQLFVIGQAVDLVQGTFRGGYWDGRNGRTYFQ